jgi:hypothetical protein
MFDFYCESAIKISNWEHYGYMQGLYSLHYITQNATRVTSVVENRSYKSLISIHI